jgi:hypothetical protein
MQCQPIGRQCGARTKPLARRTLGVRPVGEMRDQSPKGFHQLRERSRRMVSIKISRHVTPAMAPVSAARLATSYVPNAPRGSTGISETTRECEGSENVPLAQLTPHL